MALQRKEHVLSLNDFNMPMVYDSNDANYILIIRLILLEPGKFQSHPYMGVGIRSKYRFNNESNFLEILQANIKDQISTYLPDLMMTDVMLVIKDKELGIIINTETENAYVLAYNTETGDINTGASYILEDL